MTAWVVFWTLCLLVSGPVFAGITLVVLVGGVSDLKRLLSGLEEERHDREEGRTP